MYFFENYVICTKYLKGILLPASFHFEHKDVLDGGDLPGQEAHVECLTNTSNHWPDEKPLFLLFLVSNSPQCKAMDDKDNFLMIKKLSRLCWPKTNAAKSKDSAFGNLTALKAKGYIPFILHCCQKKNLKMWKWYFVRNSK